MHLHVIGADEELKPLGASSKLNAEWEFLRHLFSIGRETCDQWISKNYDDIGRQSTFNARELFVG
jgi:NTE family protein